MDVMVMYLKNWAAGKWRSPDNLLKSLVKKYFIWKVLMFKIAEPY